MENFIKEVLAASNRGVSAAKNVSGEPNWSFGQSLFFACTVITTIGNHIHNEIIIYAYINYLFQM